jgi:galactokinase
MINQDVFDKLKEKFQFHFNSEHTAAAYAPGRVEVIGNHTDYNEGYVLSAAINFGTFFACAASEDTTCRIVAADLDEEVKIDINTLEKQSEKTWSNYIIGVLDGLKAHGDISHGFNAVFLGNVPLGAGLSSSAALEMCTGLALSKLYDIEVDKQTMAKIGQKAEHNFAGVMCGLLDQFSSIYAQENSLVMSDFRSLEVQSVPLGNNTAFLMCNTKASHALVDGEYNERRQKCEEAAEFFKEKLDHEVKALRDVSWAEWEKYSGEMDETAAKRSAHPIGEDERVIKGKELLENHKLEEFGKLMFDSHESSVKYFENSCPELDTIVNACKEIPEVLGARLSGGGFGGSVVALINPENAEKVEQAINEIYNKKYGHPCDIRIIKPSSGATLV